MHVQAGRVREFRCRALGGRRRRWNRGILGMCQRSSAGKGKKNS
jgi:hypothetical protein